jgi:DNA-binding transcriptional ArsR family regulator
MDLLPTFNRMVERSHEPLLDRTYRSLAHPVRRTLLERLRQDDLRVTDAAAAFDISLAAVSKHIAVLEGSELLQRTIRGRDHVLSLHAEPLGTAAEWLAPYRAFWEGRLDALARHLGGEAR